MQLGIFGGSFDPVHLGHLRLAETAQKAARLDRVLFVPTARQPLKPGGPIASDADRVAMLRIATGQSSTSPANAFRVDAIELDRGGISYTADTLRALADAYRGARLFLILGGDALTDLPSWHDPSVILSLATILVAERDGHPPTNLSGLSALTTPERIAEIDSARLRMPPEPASSSEIRRRIAEGLPWQELTLPAVARYIEAHGLYRGV